MLNVSFNWFWLLENLWSRYVLMTLSTKNDGYAFSTRLDLILCHYEKGSNCYKF